MARAASPGKANAVSETFWVAVIDDDEAFREALCELLHALDFPCRPFANGTAFLDSPDRGVFGCILADLRMPRLGGMELQEALTSRGIPAPVVIMTSHISAHARAQAMAGGALAVLLKPISERELLPLLKIAQARAVSCATPRSAEDESPC